MTTTTFPTGPDIDEKKRWATDCCSNNIDNNNRFNCITSKSGGGGGDVWIMRRAEEESCEKSKNGAMSNGQNEQNVDDLSDNIIDSEEEDDDYTRDAIKEDEDHMKRTPFQKELYNFFELPRSLAAKLFSVFTALCTFGAVTLICINSLPKYELSNRPLLMPLGLLFNLTFTIEYLGRFFASVDKRRFFFGLMSLLDLIAILPFFIQFVVPRQESGIHVLRVLQLVRIVRLSDFIRHSIGFRAAMKVVRRSSNQILFMSFWYFVILILSSSLMFLTERGVFDAEQNLWLRENSDGDLEPSPFQSIIHSFYWSVVTLSTTGYGDDVPFTVLGRIVTGTAITCGLLVLVIPASIIGSNLSVEWTRAHRLAKLKKTQRLAQAPKNPANITLRKTRYLQRRNRELLEAIAEVQEVLAEVNPRKYYRRYQKIQVEHFAALKKIAELEASLGRWKRIACDRCCEHHQQRPCSKDIIEKKRSDVVVDDKACAVNELYRPSVRGIETFECMLPPPNISDSDYQSMNEKELPVTETTTRNDPYKQKSNTVATTTTTTTNMLNPFTIFRCSSRSSSDTHSIEQSITAPESAYLHANKDEYDHPQSVTTAPVKPSTRYTPHSLLRSATLPCGECPKYDDKDALSARENGLMDLFQQGIGASFLQGTGNEDGNSSVAIQSEKNNFLKRRAVDGGGDDADDDIEIVVEREIGKSDGS